MFHGVNQGVPALVREDGISRFIEDLVRPHVVGEHPLAAEYREAAADGDQERAARGWLEADLDDGWS